MGRRNRSGRRIRQSAYDPYPASGFERARNLPEERPLRIGPGHLLFQQVVSVEPQIADRRRRRPRRAAAVVSPEGDPEVPGGDHDAVLSTGSP